MAEMMKHEVSGHEVSKDEHETCLDLCEDLIDDLKEKEYPEEMISHLEELKAELEKYEDKDMDSEGNEMRDEDEISDKELGEAKDKELKGEKPMMKIRIKVK